MKALLKVVRQQRNEMKRQATVKTIIYPFTVFAMSIECKLRWNAWEIPILFWNVLVFIGATVVLVHALGLPSKSPKAVAALLPNASPVLLFPIHLYTQIFRTMYWNMITEARPREKSTGAVHMVGNVSKGRFSGNILLTTVREIILITSQTTSNKLLELRVLTTFYTLPGRYTGSGQKYLEYHGLRKDGSDGVFAVYTLEKLRRGHGVVRDIEGEGS